MKESILIRKGLYLTLNEDRTDICFEYEGERVADITYRGNIKIISKTKLPRGYKTEMKDFLNGLISGTIKIHISNGR